MADLWKKLKWKSGERVNGEVAFCFGEISGRLKRVGRKVAISSEVAACSVAECSFRVSPVLTLGVWVVQWVPSEP